MRVIRWFVVLVLVLAVFPAPAATAQADAPPGSVYTPLATPQRILDTRTPIGGHQRKVTAGETVALEVPGVPADATAVVVNLTGTGGSASTFLSMFPDQYAGTSTLNLDAGQNAAAGAFVTLGADRRVRILNRNGTIDVIVDLVGYLAQGGDGFTAAASTTRILDTRSPGRTALGPGQTATLAVRGAAGVPADATAALVNVTGVAPTAGTFLRVTPDGQAGTSTVNLAAGITRANVTVTRIGTDGAVRITNNSGTSHVLVDVLGWFGPSGTGRYMPLPSPKRVLDTRTGAPIGSGTSRAANLGLADVPAFPGIATLFTLTAVQPTARTYLTAWQANTARPTVSTLSAEARATVANTAVIGGTSAEVYNHAGTTHALVDALGYFYAPTRPDTTVPGAPVIDHVRNHGPKVELAWTAPDNGGLPMTGYTVTLQPGDRQISVPGNQTSTTVDGLTTGSRYTITVTATNLAGVSQASAPTEIGPPTSMTRVDTTATGQSDPDPRSWLGDVSADGRYVLITAQTSSVLVPAAYRTAEAQGTYQLRKDRQTGALDLTSVSSAGSPVLSGWSALAPDNRTLVFGTTSGVGVRDLVAGTTRTIVTARGTANHTLSGDGRWLYWTAQRSLYRYDLSANQSETLLSCTDPSTGCNIASGPVVSDDGATVVFAYSPGPESAARAATFDPVSKELRMLTESDTTGALTLSGDGTTLYYRCDNCATHTIKRVDTTTPGATPVTVEEWPTSTTMTVSPTATSTDGRVLGYFRQRRDGDWFIATPGFVMDTVDSREAMLPQVRDIAYLRGPVLSADGSIAVAEEDCQYEENCGPTGIYAVSLSPSD